MASKMFLTFDTQQKIVLAHNKDNIYKKIYVWSDYMYVYYMYYMYDYMYYMIIWLYD